MKYPYTVYYTQVEDHKFWIAECKLLKGCVGQGETLQDAVEELESNEKEWLITANDFNIPIPEIPIKNEMDYSGKFTVRVSPYVHRIAAELAKEQGISLNQYINDAIISQNSAITTSDYIVPRVKEAVNRISMVMETSYKSKTNQYYSARRFDFHNPTTWFKLIKSY